MPWDANSSCKLYDTLQPTHTHAAITSCRALCGKQKITRKIFYRRNRWMNQNHFVARPVLSMSPGATLDRSCARWHEEILRLVVHRARCLKRCNHLILIVEVTGADMSDASRTSSLPYTEQYTAKASLVRCVKASSTWSCSHVGYQCVSPIKKDWKYVLTYVTTYALNHLKNCGLTQHSPTHTYVRKRHSTRFHTVHAFISMLRNADEIRVQLKHPLPDRHL